MVYHITPTLKSLHWLQIEQRIHHKIIFITHNLIHFSQPQHVCKLTNVKPSGKTRSSKYLCLLLPPFTSKLKFSNHSFRIFEPYLRNSLPPNLKTYAPINDETTTNITNITRSSVSPLFLSWNCFLSHNKTYLFSLSFPIIPFFAMLHFSFRPDHFNLSHTKFLTQLNTREYTITLGYGFAGDIESSILAYLFYLLTELRSVADILHNQGGR